MHSLNSVHGRWILMKKSIDVVITFCQVYIAGIQYPRRDLCHFVCGGGCYLMTDMPSCPYQYKNETGPWGFDIYNIMFIKAFTITDPTMITLYVRRFWLLPFFHSILMYDKHHRLWMLFWFQTSYLKSRRLLVSLMRKYVSFNSSVSMSRDAFLSFMF